MKNIGIALFALMLMASCGDDKKTDTSASTSGGDTSISAGPPPEPAADPEVNKGLDLAAKSDCFTCHKLNETSVGPSYAAVAAKYKGQPGIADSLAGKIIKGGAGVWGTVPMTPHPTLSKEDAKSMVAYIMSIK